MIKALSFLFFISAQALFTGPVFLRSVSYEYDPVKDEIICTALPEESISSREVNGPIHGFVGPRQKFSLKKCRENGIERPRYKWATGEKGNSCYQVITIEYEEVPIKKVNKDLCSVWSGEIDLNRNYSQLKKRSLFRVVNATCRDLTNCLSILGPENKDLITNISQAMRELSPTKKQEQVLRSETEYKSLRKEHLQLLNQVEGALEKCQSKLPPARESLNRDLRKMIKTLERDILSFHYFNPDKIHLNSREDNPGRNSIRGLIYANVMESLFWDETNTGDMIGPGLYASPDPRTTKDYGDFMLEIEIKKGTRYLDLREANNRIIISGQTKELLAGEGCLTRDAQPVPTPTHLGDYPDGAYALAKAKLYRDPQCRKLFNDSIQDTGSGFLAYNYRQDLRSYCDDRYARNTSTAFVLYDIPLNPNTINLFEINDQNRDDERDYQRIRTIADLPTSLSHQEKKQIQEEAKEKLIHCSKEHNDNPIKFQN